MKIEAAIGNWTNVSQSILAYLPVEPGVTSLSGISFLSEVPTSIMLDTDYTVPRVLNIRRSHLLATPEKWFSTNANSTAYSPTQGELILSGAAAVTGDQPIRIWWSAEFKNSTWSSLDLVMRLKEEEKKVDELTDQLEALKKTKRI
jgi:hypothetical protein